MQSVANLFCFSTNKIKALPKTWRKESFLFHSSTQCAPILAIPQSWVIQHHSNSCLVTSPSPNISDCSDIIRQRSSLLDVKKFCVQHTVQLGSKEYTKKRLVELESRFVTCSILPRFQSKLSGMWIKNSFSLDCWKISTNSKEMLFLRISYLSCEKSTPTLESFECSNVVNF